MSQAVVLDAGALIALDRNDRKMWAILKVAAGDGSIVAVPAGVVAQAWRDGSRHALLARALSHCATVDLTDDRARAAGLLCGQTGTADIVDATVALCALGLAATAEVTVFTSDPTDIDLLTQAVSGAVQIETV